MLFARGLDIAEVIQSDQEVTEGRRQLFTTSTTIKTTALSQSPGSVASGSRRSSVPSRSFGPVMSRAGMVTETTASSRSAVNETTIQTVHSSQRDTPVPHVQNSLNKKLRV